MAREFREWLITEKILGHDLSPDERKEFLKILRDDPERVVRTVGPHMDQFASMYVLEHEEAIVLDLGNNKTAREIIEYMRSEFLKEEIATIV